MLESLDLDLRFSTDELILSRSPDPLDDFFLADAAAIAAMLVGSMTFEGISDFESLVAVELVGFSSFREALRLSNMVFSAAFGSGLSSFELTLAVLSVASSDDAPASTGGALRLDNIAMRAALGSGSTLSSFTLSRDLASSSGSAFRFENMAFRAAFGSGTTSSSRLDASPLAVALVATSVSNEF